MHLITHAKHNSSALELERHLGVAYPTAWPVKPKIMEVMRQREESRQLGGRAEIDGAYLGREHRGGKPGRGSPNKSPFVDAVHTTESGSPVLASFSQRPFTKKSLPRSPSPPRQRWSPKGWAVSPPSRAPVSFTSPMSPAEARPA